MPNTNISHKCRCAFVTKKGDAMSVIYQNRTENLTAKISLNNAYPAHIHRQVELFYVLDGALEVTIGQKKCLLTKDCLSVTFPDLIHQTNTPVSSTALMLIFDTRELPDYHNDFMSHLPETPFLYNVSEYTDLSDALKKLITYARGEVSTPRLLKGYLCVFLNFLLEQLTLHPNTAEQPELCQKIAEYLNTHFTESISLSSLSHELGYNKYHISHVCNENFGCSLSDYVNHLRVEHAMGLLMHSNLSITDVCYASGFNSLRTFYRVFKERYGQTPGTLHKEL